MNQFRVLDSLKAIKKTSSGLIGSFNIKKNSKSIRELFSNKNSFLIKKVTFYIKFLSMTNLLYSQMKPIEQKNRLQGNAHVCFSFDSEFS